MESRLGLCYALLESLKYLHTKKFAVGNLSLSSILLVRSGLRFSPKIMNFDEGQQNCTS